ncbi:MAG: hypothetical protein FWD68_19940, partial [Alphaproteobacteria bacterium]|nr:hypothetical protein [Alphaproteobacteria bacterium]
GVPAVDETGEPLQIALIVEKASPSKDSLSELAETMIADAKLAPNLDLVKNSRKSVKLADGTAAELISLEFIKGGSRRSLQLKLISKSRVGVIWTVTGALVGGKASRLPSPESAIATWLTAHMTSLTFDPGDFDPAKMRAAYAALSQSPTGAARQGDPPKP